jgi:hypothetical protein
MPQQRHFAECAHVRTISVSESDICAADTRSRISRQATFGVLRWIFAESNGGVVQAKGEDQ